MEAHTQLGLTHSANIKKLYVRVRKKLHRQYLWFCQRPQKEGELGSQNDYRPIPGFDAEMW